MNIFPSKITYSSESGENMVKGMQHGFTLIEILIAIFILSIGILAYISSQNSAIRGTALSGTINQALLIANSHAEEILYQDYDSISSFTDNKNSGGINYSTNCTLLSSSVPNTKHFKITVSWTFQGENYNINIQTVKIKNNGV